MIKDTIQITDTHSHLDGEEFREDLDDVVRRAKDAGVGRVFVPGINMASIPSMQTVCARFPGFAYPMIGLHPEEVDNDYQLTLKEMKEILDRSVQGQENMQYIGIGEVGLDYYWSREYENQQLEAFEQQVGWSIEYRLPLMIHCRKAQNEMVRILKKYENELVGGVFHCFTGNVHEAEELLAFKNFMLGIGGVLTFKKSHLPEVLSCAVPLNRIVLETDSPYMAPVPMRGNRNESAFIIHVVEKLASVYGTDQQTVIATTNTTVNRVFPNERI